jgi:hypothetical protein
MTLVNEVVRKTTPTGTFVEVYPRNASKKLTVSAFG